MFVVPLFEFPLLEFPLFELPPPTFSTTVTVQVAFLLPSCDVTVIIVEPSFFGVIFPALSTVATVSSLEVHVTILFVAPTGLNVGLSVIVFPIATFSVFGNEILYKLIVGFKLSTNE